MLTAGTLTLSLRWRSGEPKAWPNAITARKKAISETNVGFSTRISGQRRKERRAAETEEDHGREKRADRKREKEGEWWLLFNTGPGPPSD